MSFYSDVKKRNVIGKAGHLLDVGALLISAENRRLELQTKVSWKTPWRHIRQSDQVNCSIWSGIVFEQIMMINLPRSEWFVPSDCQDCFKVVARPESLKQLFAIESIQVEMDHYSKCGLDLRVDVFGHYGSYWYNRGLQDGIKCYKKVRSVIDNHADLGPGVSVILKRACTEYERALGASDKWTLTPANIEFENIIRERIETDVCKIYKQTDLEIDNIHEMWIRKASSWGDETVSEYLHGETLFPKYVTYHHMVKEPS